METIELWPFSQGEIDDTPDRFIDNAFARGPLLTHTSRLRRRDYLERIVRGGYPKRYGERNAEGRPSSTPT